LNSNIANLNDRETDQSRSDIGYNPMASTHLNDQDNKKYNVQDHPASKVVDTASEKRRSTVRKESIKESSDNKDAPKTSLEQTSLEKPLDEEKIERPQTPLKSQVNEIDSQIDVEKRNDLGEIIEETSVAASKRSSMQEIADSAARSSQHSDRVVSKQNSEHYNPNSQSQLSSKVRTNERLSEYREERKEITLITKDRDEVSKEADKSFSRTSSIMKDSRGLDNLSLENEQLRPIDQQFQLSNQTSSLHITTDYQIDMPTGVDLQNLEKITKQLNRIRISDVVNKKQDAPEQTPLDLKAIVEAIKRKHISL